MWQYQLVSFVVARVAGFVEGLPASGGLVVAEPRAMLLFAGRSLQNRCFLGAIVRSHNKGHLKCSV